MAQTEHLPIYKAAYDLCLYFEQVVRNFPRYHKYSLGTDLRDGARRVLKPVVRANAQRDKTATLLQIREELEELKVLLRLCHDVRAFANFNAFEHAVTQVTAIAKQNEGWLKSQRQDRGQNRPVMPAGLVVPSVAAVERSVHGPRRTGGVRRGQGARGGSPESDLCRAPGRSGVDSGSVGIGLAAARGTPQEEEED